MDNQKNSNGKQPKAGAEQRRSVQKDTRDYRRFIEESFPVKELGAASSALLLHPQNILLFVFNCTWISNPITVLNSLIYHPVNSWLLNCFPLCFPPCNSWNISLIALKKFTANS